MTFDPEELKNIQFNHAIDVQMRFNDIDGFMHINNAVQVSYFDIGKVDYMEKLGFQFPDEDGDTLLVVNINVDFLSQIRFGDPVIVKTKIYELGHKSVKLIQMLQNKNNGTVYSLCHCVMCGYNVDTKSSIVIPDKWKEKVNDYEHLY